MSCFHASSAPASEEARKRVPTLTPAASSASAAAKPRPSATPPAASTGIGSTASTTWGTSAIEPTPADIPWPPASLPWAMTTSTPRRAASRAWATVCTWWITLAPTECARSTSPPRLAEGERHRRRGRFESDLEGLLVQNRYDVVHDERAIGELAHASYLLA